MEPWEQACKPGSVECGHLSRVPVTRHLQQSTRGSAGRLISPYVTLLRVGCTEPAGYPAAGALLPHLFTLAPLRGWYVSVALSSGSPPLGVTQHPALRSPDFPRARSRPRPHGLLPAYGSMAPFGIQRAVASAPSSARLASAS